MPNRHAFRAAIAVAVLSLILHDLPAQTSREEDEEDLEQEEESREEPRERATADLKRSVRLRFAGFFPEDLPTDVGTLLGIEFRNMLNERDGIAYGIYLYDEQKTEFSDLSFGGGPVTFTFKADIQIQPILVSWFRTWQRGRVAYFAGAGGGVYLVDAFSGGFSSQAGVQIRDAGDFRFIEDGAYIGAHAYIGADFFPGRRWGASAEARVHLVEESLSAGEISVGGLLRF